MKYTKVHNVNNGSLFYLNENKIVIHIISLGRGDFSIQVNESFNPIERYCFDCTEKESRMLDKLMVFK